jgi:hypothetical protein
MIQMVPSAQYEQKSSFHVPQHTKLDYLAAAWVLALEFLMLILIVTVGVLHGMHEVDVWMHAMVSASTIATVHCISTCLHVSGYIRRCNKYKDISEAFGVGQLYALYKGLLQAELQRRTTFLIWTSLTILFWVINAICYVDVLASHARQQNLMVVPIDWVKYATIAFATATVALSTYKALMASKNEDKLDFEWFSHELLAYKLP